MEFITGHWGRLEQNDIGGDGDGIVVVVVVVVVAVVIIIMIDVFVIIVVREGVFLLLFIIYNFIIMVTN